MTLGGSGFPGCRRRRPPRWPGIRVARIAHGGDGQKPDGGLRGPTTPTQAANIMASVMVATASPPSTRSSSAGVLRRPLGHSRAAHHGSHEDEKRDAARMYSEACR